MITYEITALGRAELRKPRATTARLVIVECPVCDGPAEVSLVWADGEWSYLDTNPCATRCAITLEQSEAMATLAVASASQEMAA